MTGLPCVRRCGDAKRTKRADADELEDDEDEDEEDDGNDDDDKGCCCC